MTKENEIEIGNVFAHKYDVSPGHPHYSPRSRFLGRLGGTWREIGVQIGEKAGDLVRWVSDVWWKEHVEKWGFEETMNAMPLYEAQIAALNPNLIEFMEAIAEGAADELDKSPYAQASSHYEKVLNTNIFDAWSWRHPTDDKIPWKNARDSSDTIGCSSFVTIGDGPNKHDEAIAAHNRHCPFNPKCYQIVYIGMPNDGNAFWVLTNGAEGAACQVVNDRGVSLILNAGGNQSEKHHANDFGVSWFLLFLHIAAYANNAEEAIEMITKGTPEYRENTGRKSLLRTGTWNFLISDRNNCAIVETTCNRYAIRRPGDVGEIGAYLVMTNHNYCDYSYDEENRLTDIPMTKFGSEETSQGSAKRFWTLMWDIRHNYGNIDLEMAMQFMKGHHQNDKDGHRIESAEGEMPLQFTGDVTCPHHGGYPEKWLGGSAVAKIAKIPPFPPLEPPFGIRWVGDLTIYWTMGRPCEWKGAWEHVSI